MFIDSIIVGDQQLLSDSHYNTVLNIDSYLGTRLCDKKIALYYDRLLSCLQIIPDPDLLDVTNSDDIIKVNFCNSQANQSDQMAYCFSHSDYRYIQPICSKIVHSQEYKNDVFRAIEEVLCIYRQEYLVGSGDAAINFRRQFDGSSFIECSSNFDCPHDEFCSIQGVQRCEKIISAYNDDTILVTAVQMEEIIKDKNNKVVGGGDNHSRINSITLDDGARYVARDVSVLGLIDRYYSEEERRTMDLWIE